MRGDYSIYDSLYEKAKQAGWQGWGGNTRVAGGPDQVQLILGKDYVPRQGRVLELGCGEGHLCRLLAGQGYDVTGVDVSGVAIEWAIEKHSGDTWVTYVQADMCQPGVLPGQAFDLIVDGNCLHCILGEDRSAFLGNVHRLLSNRGIFFVSSLCSKRGGPITLRQNGKAYRHLPSAASLVKELSEAHLQVLDWEVRKRHEHDHINLFAKRNG